MKLDFNIRPYAKLTLNESALDINHKVIKLLYKIIEEKLFDTGFDNDFQDMTQKVCHKENMDKLDIRI